MNVCIFNIGTWHTHTENCNLLVRLWTDCLSGSFENLGVIENQNGNKKKGNEPFQNTANWKHPAKKNFTWINDGADSTGDSIPDQTESNMKVLEALSNKESIENVVIVGHSRGAILAVRIAAALYQRQNHVKCHLLLYDPVKRMLQGFDSENREIRDNVKSIVVVAMEDQTQDDFKLLTIKRRTAGQKGHADLAQSEYIRLPGTHGTATQLTGHPIGQVGYILAYMFLEKRGIKIAAPSLSTDLLKAYCRIPRINRISIKGGVKYRNVNNYEEQKHFKIIRTGTFKQETNDVKVGGHRTAKLDEKAGRNIYLGHKFFVNQQHFGLFAAQYPNISDSIERLEVVNQGNVHSEMAALINADRDTHDFLQDSFSFL